MDGGGDGWASPDQRLLGAAHLAFARAPAASDTAVQTVARPGIHPEAALYTIVQTAKLNGVNPEAYLRDTLARIADGHPINRIGELMPWRSLPIDAGPPAA